MKPKIIVVLGPTASGKTSMSIKLAKEFNGEVISVDSRQIYREMNIGTAKEPKDEAESTKYEVQGVTHWGIDLVNPNQEMTAAGFKEYAEQKIEDIVSRGKLPILAGGTGFWIQAVVDNLDIPAVAPDRELRKVLESKELEDLFVMYQEKDPAGAETIDRQNKFRLIRALEVCFKTGKPFSEQQQKGESKYDVLQIGIEVDREELYRRINTRVDQMVEEGLVEEVQTLKEKYGCVGLAMTGIGYRQVCEYLENKNTLEEALERIKIDTRHYAKRQLTWWRRDDRIHWVKEYEKVRDLVQRFV